MIRRNPNAEDIEVYNELTKYRNLPQISDKTLFGLVGTTVNGDSVLFPDSLQRGFSYELTPIGQRPQTEFEILGIANVTSDGHMNYTPSFNKGREIARELKFYVLAEMMKKVSQENHGLKGKIDELRTKLDNFINKQ